MILTCPQCATRYFLPDLQIGSAGRKVKCAQCGETWRESAPVESSEEQPLPDIGFDIFDATAPTEAEAQIQAQTAADAEAEAEAEDPFAEGAGRRADILREKKADADRKAKQAATVTIAVWEGLGAAVVIALVLGAVFRGQVVKFAPGLATAYAAVGLPVNSAGLMIEKVQATPGMLSGHKALMVTGTLRNVAGRPVKVPAFRVDLLDQNGHVLDRKIIQITAPPLQTAEARPFSLGVADPAPGYQGVDVTFALPQKPGAAPAKAAPAKAAPTPEKAGAPA